MWYCDIVGGLRYFNVRLMIFGDQTAYDINYQNVKLLLRN